MAPAPFLKGEAVTYREIIKQVDDAKPNSFDESLKLKWLQELNGKIAADVFLMSIVEVRALQGSYPEAMDHSPLVSFPHEDIYDFWLRAKIDFANDEMDRYQNTMALYNEAYTNFVCWFVSNYEPAQGYEEE